VADRNAVVRDYAQALLTVAQAEGELDATVDQFYAFGKALEREGRVYEALVDPALPAENKRGLVSDLLGGRANPNVVNSVVFIVDQGRARELPAIADALADEAAERRRHVVAEVRSAVPLDGPKRERLAEALSQASGRTVEVKVVVDPSVVGGVVARIGDEIYDGTVRTRLDEAREHLANAQ
jgi:F-type H+-transporting ATPase subunit delta